MSKFKSQALLMALLLPAMMGESMMPPQRKLRKFKALPEPIPQPRSEEYKAQKKKARAKTKKRRKKRGY